MIKKQLWTKTYIHYRPGKGKANVFANAIKHDFRSKNPTTRWSDIISFKKQNAKKIPHNLHHPPESTIPPE